MTSQTNQSEQYKYLKISPNRQMSSAQADKAINFVKRSNLSC